jgi:hypothetical protein
MFAMFVRMCSFQKLIFSTAAKIFCSTSRIKTDGEGVGFLNPLLAMAQVVNVSRPGSEPDIHQAVAEDVRLMCSSLADKKGEQGVASDQERQSSSAGERHIFSAGEHHTFSAGARHIFLAGEQQNVSAGKQQNFLAGECHIFFGCRIAVDGAC